MKAEKLRKESEPKNPKDIETQKFDNVSEFMRWENDRDNNLRRMRKLVAGGVAIPDFEKDSAGNIKSLTIKRMTDNSILFYADDKTFEGQEDIKKFME